ncbi:glycosyltransferase [Orbus sasakiae]|uniref:Glycosyltransferase n=1 Tax=Orbus sasakiae TaxID=1078475 RepID=A0ABP9NDY4_9GAMM
MKDLAVLIPVYNDHTEIIVTLNSIREKDNEFKVIIVDDGSTSPLKIDTSLFPFEIIVIALPQNQGIVEALNSGLRYILQDKNINYIARLDAGDLQREDRLNIQYEYMRSNPDIFLLGSAVNFISEEGVFLYTYQPPLIDSEIKNKIFLRCCFIHPSVIINKTVFEKIDIYSEKYIYAEDYDLFLRITQNYRVANLPNILLSCSIREKGISNSKRRVQMKNTLNLLINNRHYNNIYWFFGITVVIVKWILPRSFFSYVKTIINKILSFFRK